MNSVDSAFELVFLRFRQIILKNPTYFNVFNRSPHPFCPLFTLVHSPHVKPICVKKSLSLNKILRFLARLSHYFCRLIASIFISKNIFISSSRWSNRSSRYERTLAFTFSQGDSCSYLYFSDYLDTSYLSGSSLPHILFQPIIRSFLSVPVSTRLNKFSADNSEYAVKYNQSILHFYDLLAKSLSYKINVFISCFTQLLFRILVAFFDFLYYLFPGKTIYYISTNCWSITDYLFYVLSFSKFNTKLIGCQHGCKYFESNDPFTTIEISSPCFEYFFSFGTLHSQFHPDDILNLVPQRSKYDVVYIMKYVPLETAEIPHEIERLISVLARLSKNIKIQIRVHPKSKHLYPLLKTKFADDLFSSTIEFVLFDNKHIGLPLCKIAIFDSPFSTLAWHTVSRDICTVFADQSPGCSLYSSLYERHFLIDDNDDNGLRTFIHHFLI